MNTGSWTPALEILDRIKVGPENSHFYKFSDDADVGLRTRLGEFLLYAMASVETSGIFLIGKCIRQGIAFGNAKDVKEGDVFKFILFNVLWTWWSA